MKTDIRLNKTREVHIFPVTILRFTKKMILQAPHWHVLIHQEPLILVSAIANQCDKIWMVQ